MFEITLSIGDMAAVITCGAMLFGFQRKILSIFNKFCTELKIMNTKLENFKERLELLENR